MSINKVIEVAIRNLSAKKKKKKKKSMDQMALWVSSNNLSNRIYISPS